METSTPIPASIELEFKEKGKPAFEGGNLDHPAPNQNGCSNPKGVNFAKFN